MKVREAKKSEYPLIYEQGYREWAKGRTLQQYIKDNQKEEAYGTRYVLINNQEEIAASLMMLRFHNHLFGIGSIVVDSAFRKQGLGKRLIEESMKLHPDAAFILYSEIGASYYKQFGFQELAQQYQRFQQCVCMVRAEKELFERILKEPIPAYF
jgi:predicted GNAT family N-acyltransferase